MMILEKLKGKVIVSSQAMPNEPFYDEMCMMAMMQSVINGGASGLRVAGKRDVINAKSFGVPVIGLTKPDKLPENWRSVVYITPSIKEVKDLIDAKFLDTVDDFFPILCKYSKYSFTLDLSEKS